MSLMVLITHITISEIKMHPMMTVMSDPLIKPTLSTDNSYTIDIRYALWIVTHIVKLMAHMRISASFKLIFFMIFISIWNEKFR